MRRPEERLRERGGHLELLRAPASLFRLAAGVRGRLYDRRLLPIWRLDVPIVSVGNLTVGGTGKTPFVVLLARALERRGRRPGILSRGYRALRGADGGRDAPAERRNDEGLLFDQLLPEVPHVQRPDRVEGGRELERLGVDVVLLDDGFQHRRLHRDLDLVLVDATRPWGLPAPRGGGEPVCAFLPRGLLRERPAALVRADAVVLTRVDLCPDDDRERLRAEVHAVAPGPPVLEVAQRPSALVDDRGVRCAPGELRDRRVDLVSALGNPDAFAATVRALGARIDGHRAFPDHHVYRRADLEGLGAEGRALVTTAKDAVKLAGLGVPHLVLELELEVRSGAAVLDALLDALPAPGKASRDALHGGLHG